MVVLVGYDNDLDILGLKGLIDDERLMAGSNGAGDPARVKLVLGDIGQ